MIELTPFSREEYLNSYIKDPDPLEDARRLMIRMWQGIGAKSSDKTGWRANINLNQNKANEWSSLSERILTVAGRLKQAQIERQDAFKLIDRYNRDGVLMYVDPPYLLSTRSKRLYKHEFTFEDHQHLLDVVAHSKAKIILSGYDSPLYDLELKDWNTATFEQNAETGVKRTEKLWCNFPLPQLVEQEQMELLGDAK